MANPTKLVLQAIAEVQKAKTDILSLVEAVNTLAKATGAVAGQKFEVQTQGAIADIGKLEAALEKLAQSSVKSAKARTKADREAAAEEGELTQKQIASILKRMAAQDREVQKQAVSLARKNAALAASIAAEEKANQRAAESAENAARRKQNALLQEARNRDAAFNRQFAQGERMALAIERQIAKDKAAADAKRNFVERIKEATNAMRLFVANIVVQRVSQFVGEIIRAGAAFEGYKNTLDAALGSTVAAQEEIDRLRGVANTFGVDFEVLLQRFGRFKIAADSIGISAERTRTIFDGFVAVSRALGNTNEQTERTFVALEQIMSKGVVQSEELKQQLGDSLVGAYNKLGAAIGKTGVEFEKMLKENQILAKQAIPQLLEEFLKLTGASIQKNINSLNAELARTKNTIFDAKRIIAEEARPELLALLQNFRSIGTDGVLSFTNVGKAVGELVQVVDDLFVAINSILQLRLGDTLAIALARVAEGFLAVRTAAIEGGIAIASAWARARGRSEEFIEAQAEAFRKLKETQVQGVRDFIGGLRDSTHAAEESAKRRVEVEKKAAEDIAKLNADVAIAAAEARAEQLAGEQELTKAQLKEISKREDAFESFFARLADLAKKNPIQIDAPEIPSGGGAGAGIASAEDFGRITAFDEKVRTLTESIAALQAEKKELNSDSWVTGGQIARVEEIDQKIRVLEQTLARAKQVAETNSIAQTLENQAKAAAKTEAAMAKYAQTIQAALVDLVRDNDAFRDSFLRLDTDGKLAVQGLLSSFESLSATGKVTQADFQNFLAALAEQFGRAGVIGQEFATQLSASFGQTDQSATALLGTLAQLGDATAKANEAQAAGAAAVTEAETIKRAEVTATGEVFIQSELEKQAKAQETVAVVGQATTVVLTGVSAANQQLQAQVATGAAIMLDETGKAAGVVGQNVQDGMTKAGESIKGVATDVEATSKKAVAEVEATTEKAVAFISNTYDRALGVVRDFGDVTIEVGEKGAKSITNVSDAAKDTAGAVGSAVVAIKNSEGQIVGFESTVEQAGDAAVRAFNDSKKAVADTVPPAQTVEKAVAGIKTSSEGMARAADRAKTGYEGMKEPIEAVPVALDAATIAMRAFNVEATIGVGLVKELRDVVNSIDI